MYFRIVFESKCFKDTSAISLFFMIAIRFSNPSRVRKIPLENKTMVSRNSWKLILPSWSLSTMLNILVTKRSASFIPRAEANSFLLNVVLITMITSLVASSSLRFSPKSEFKTIHYLNGSKCRIFLSRRNLLEGFF